MGFFDFFREPDTAPFLTEAQVKDMERKARQTTQQQGLITRYLKAYNADTVGQAEIDLLWRLGKGATHEQVRTIQQNSPKILRATNKAIATKTANHIESYAQSLINRGGSQGATK